MNTKENLRNGVEDYVRSTFGEKSLSTIRARTPCKHAKNTMRDHLGDKQ